MKNTIGCIFFLALFVSAIGQDYSDHSNTYPLEEFDVEITLEANELKAKLDTTYFHTDPGEAITIEFALDTFRIERLVSKKIDFNSSTIGMLQATYDKEKDYDQLLNKYYNKLIEMLNEEDKAILITAQKNWMSFRDSERIFNQLISRDEYSGGGTIQKLLVADRYTDITKKRVLELHTYLLRRLEGVY